jgi:hypothetical protein
VLQRQVLKKYNQAGGMTQNGRAPSKCEALNSIPSTAKMTVTIIIKTILNCSTM